LAIPQVAAENGFWWRRRLAGGFSDFDMAQNPPARRRRHVHGELSNSIWSLITWLCPFWWMTAMIPRLVIHADRMRAATSDGFLLATDVADYLVTKGVPFREAHHIVGQAVRRCIESRRRLEDLTLKEWRELSPAFDADVREQVQELLRV